MAGLVRRLTLGLACVLLLTGARVEVMAQEAPDPVVVAGQPPLTRGMLDRFVGFMEWLLDVPLTTEQRGDVMTGIVKSWETGATEEQQGVLNVLGLAAQVGQRSAAEQALVREQLQALVLEKIRQMPEDATAKWMLAVYDAGHQPIADGDPPLTRQVADAFAELMCFMLGEVIGQEVPTPAQFREAAAALLVERYAQLAPEGQKQVSQLPIVWAALRVAWPTFSDDEKAQYRNQWRGFLTASLPQQQAGADDQTAAAPAQQGDNDLKALVDQKMAADPMHQAMTAQFMSNLLQTQHNGNMAMLYSMGGSGWTYSSRW